MLLSQTDVPYGEENTFFITVAGGKLFSWWHFCSENIKLKMTNGFKYLKGQNEILKKKTWQNVSDTRSAVKYDQWKSTSLAF